MKRTQGTFDEVRQVLDLEAAEIVTAEKTGEPVDGLEIEAEERDGEVIWTAEPVDAETTPLDRLADYRGISESVAERIGSITSVDSVEELVDLASHGPLAEYDGIGEKTEYYVLQALSGMGADIDGVRLQELYEEVGDKLDEPYRKETPVPRRVYAILNEELGDSVRITEDRNANEGIVVAIHGKQSVIDPDGGDKELLVVGVDYYETPKVETDNPSLAASAIERWSEGKRLHWCDEEYCPGHYTVEFGEEDPGYCCKHLEDNESDPDHPVDDSPINGRTANGLIDAGFHGADDALNLIGDTATRDAAVDALQGIKGVGQKGAAEVVVWLEELGLWSPEGGAGDYPDWVREPDDARQHILARQAVDAAETDGAVPRTDGMDTEVKNDLQAWLRDRNDDLDESRDDWHAIDCPHCEELFAKVPPGDEGPEGEAECVADPDDDLHGDRGETFWITREDEGFATHTSDPADMCESDASPEEDGGEVQIEPGTPAAEALKALDTSDDDRPRAERPDARKIAVQLVDELGRPATYQSHDDHSILLEVGEDLPVTVKRLTHDEIEGRVFRILVAESRTIGSNKPKTIVPDAIEKIESHFEDSDDEPDTEDPTDIRDSEGTTESGEGDGKSEPDAESGKAESKSGESEDSDDDLWASAPDEDPDRWQGEPLDVPQADRPHPLLTSCRSVGVYEHGSEQWDETRAKGIGSSDVGAILGLSEHADPEDIWKAKVPGEEPGDKPWLSEYAAFGTWFESYIREAAEERHGLEIIPGEDLGTLEAEGWGKARANIDGLDVSTRGGVIEEIKTTSEEWDRVPRDYFAQVQHQMMVCGLREARVRQYVAPMPRDLVPSLLDEIRAEMLAPEDADRLLADWLLEHGDLETWIVERDDEWIARMLAREREFWGYVEREEPPPDVDPEGAVDLSDDPEVVAALEAFARRKHRLAEALETDEGQDLEDLADEAKDQAREAIEEQVALMDGEPKRVTVGDHKATRKENYGTEYWRLYPDTDAVEEW